MEQIERYRGCLLGLAAGDAVGTTLEFKSPGSFAPIEDMVGGGPFGLAPGQWTDDTSMALCLAESLVERKGFDPVDQLEKYVRWYREGYLSSTPISGYWEENPLSPEIDEIADGSFRRREPPQIKGKGHVVKSLEAALWAFHRGDIFREGCLLAVNLGDDADTTGAVYGQLAGAFWGEKGIPESWRAKLAHRPLIESLAERLLDLSETL